MVSTKYIGALVLGLSSLTVAVTIPRAEKVYPEVIPGDGLPSLASLNLTSAQLYEMPIDESLKKNLASLYGRAAGFTPGCGPTNDAYTDVGDIIACFNYLNSLGHKFCTAGSGAEVVQMCAAGQAQILGQSISGGSSSSYCSDVASAVLWSINDCTRPDQSCAGFQAANGNGNLIIGSVNIKY